MIDVRVIILTGAGRGFCAGADMSLLSGIADQWRMWIRVTRSHITQTGEQRAGHRARFPAQVFLLPFDSKKPVIAAINGPAVGLGLIITLYCDLRFAADPARFGTAFARRGLIAEYGVAWMLPRLDGPGECARTCCCPRGSSMPPKPRRWDS